MKAFDFDNTIYDGESLYDFFFFLMKKKKQGKRYIPLIIKTLIMYKLKLIDIYKANKTTGKLTKLLIENKKDAKELVNEFWELNRHKLKPGFLKMIKRNDIIITGSPDILINGIRKELKTKHIISSEFNLKTMQFDFFCIGEEKITAFKKKYGKKKIKEFYSDSMNDAPMMRYAEKAFLVKKNRIIQVNID